MSIKISMAAARVNAGLKQREAAEQIGVTVTTIRNWERGVTSPKYKQKEAIESAYNIPLDNIKFF